MYGYDLRIPAGCQQAEAEQSEADALLLRMWARLANQYRSRGDHGMADMVVQHVIRMLEPGGELSNVIPIPLQLQQYEV